MVDPQLILLSGGISQAGNILLAKVWSSIEKQSWSVLPIGFTLKLAQNTSNAGWVGAGLAAKASLESQQNIKDAVKKRSGLVSLRVFLMS
jgi:hypothetical protein